MGCDGVCASQEYDGALYAGMGQEKLQSACIVADLIVELQLRDGWV